MKRLLILGGTGEAAVLAERVDERFGERIEIITSLAGRTRKPRVLPGRIRSGGFGGANGLARYLDETRVNLVIDATHPFATRISANARAACETARVPRIILRRPAWTPQPGDNWICVADSAAAARRLPQIGSRAFLALGSGDVAPFDGLEGVFLLLRVAEKTLGKPLPGAEMTVGRGPFREADELRLLRDWRIDVIVSRNSGGAATVGKISAARRLAIPIIMIRRPEPEPGPCMNDIEEIVAWIAERLA